MIDTRRSAVYHPNGFSEYEAIITAGGMGTRMLPFSKEIPKEMFPIIIVEKPVHQYTMNESKYVGQWVCDTCYDHYLGGFKHAGQ